MLSYIDDDDARDTDDGQFGYHIGVGKGLNAASSVEFSAVAAFYNADGFNADQQQWGLGVDYIRRFGNTDYFVPYAIVGTGLLKTQNDNRFEKDGRGLMTSFGVGILTPLNLYDVMLRTELRVRTDYSVDTRHDFLLSFGLQRAIKPKPVLYSDSDNDGVINPLDRCENTPRNVVVDRYGCARIQDRDSDGVPDEKDMCGGSPAGSEVDDSGCRRTVKETKEQK